MIYHKIPVILILAILFQFCNNSTSEQLAVQKYYPSMPSVKFPRLLGMQIGRKHYQDSLYIDQISRLDIAIMGFYRNWSQEGYTIPDVLRQLKKLNPQILIGQYTILNETQDDIENTALADVRDIIYNQEWWLKNATNQKVQWTAAYNAWEINISHWVTPTNDGIFYPEWLANRDYTVFFKDNPEFTIWYFDNVFLKSRVIADWDGDKKNDNPSSNKIINTVQNAHVEEWITAKKLRSDIYLMGNVDHDLSNETYINKLNGAFLEALMGESWSIETQQGWGKMMTLYHNTIKNTIYPNLVGFNVWGDNKDYKFFRYAFNSCLLNDGYFSFTDKEAGYSSVPWYDEYDLDFGIPLEPPVTEARKDGIYSREFTNVLVLVNPTRTPVEVKLDKYYSKFKGVQDSTINNDMSVNRLILDAKDGIILLKN
jgi:hypothetical protein